MKNIGDFYLKIFSFLEIKFSIYLNRRVFVMVFVFEFGYPTYEASDNNVDTHMYVAAFKFSLAKLYILVGCFEYESRNSSGVQITLSPTVTIYKIWVSVFEEAGANYITKARPYITKTRLFKYTENFTSKNWKFSDKKLWYFSYFCPKHRLWYSLEPPRRGGSNEYPQSMFLSRNKNNNVYPCKPQFYYTKVGFKGIKII